MKKRILSILLTVAMLASMVAIGFGSFTTSANSGTNSPTNTVGGAILTPEERNNNDINGSTTVEVDIANVLTYSSYCYSFNVKTISVMGFTLPVTGSCTLKFETSSGTDTSLTTVTKSSADVISTVLQNTFKGWSVQPYTYTIDFTNFSSRFSLGKYNLALNAVATADYVGSHNYPISREFNITCSHNGSNGGWGAWSTTTPATCTTKGSKTRTCSVCGATETEEIGLLPHTAVTDAAVTATCITNGKTAGSHCSVCGYVITAQTDLGTDSNNHTDVRTESVVNPTCTTGGYTSYKCYGCGATWTGSATVALGHDWDSGSVLSAATCTTAGTKRYTCQRSGCGVTEDRTIDIDSNAHSWGTGVEKTAATCSATGVMEYTCNYNSTHKKTEDIAKNPNNHNLSGWTESIGATCTADGLEVRTCSWCTAVIESRTITATGHTPGAAATCTTAQTCTRCGATLANALGHTPGAAATCTTPQKCTVCQAVLVPAPGHTAGGWQVVTPATVHGPGLKERHCTVCSVLLDSEVIPQLDSADYSALNKYINEYVPANNDAGIYTSASYTLVKNILDNIDYALDDSQQGTVDGYLASLKAAVPNLVADESRAVATYELTSSETTVHPGDVFDVDLGLTTNYGVVAASACIIYDSTVFALHTNANSSTIGNYVDTSEGCLADYTLAGNVNATETLFSSKNNNATYWSECDDYRAVYLTLSYNKQSGNYVTPNGEIATIQFEAIADEVTPVEGNIFMSSDFNKTVSFGAGVNYASRGVGVTLGTNASATCVTVGQTLNVDSEGAEITVQHTPGPDATCTAPQVCTVYGCGKVLAETLPHTPVTDAAVAPKCEETGLTEGSHCSVCNTVITAQETLPATGHTEVTDAYVASNCTETGLTEGKHCSVCDKVLLAQEVIPATGHTEVTDAAVEPSCTETGLTEGKHCSVCNTVITAQETIPATGHTEVTDAYVAPTCTQTGLTEGKHCSVCDEVLIAQEEIEALGHLDTGDWETTVPSTCRVAGTEVKYCQRGGCGVVIDTREAELLPHTPGEWTQTIAPTATAAGEETQSCTVCGQILGTRPIPPLESPADYSELNDFIDKYVPHDNEAGIYSSSSYAAVKEILDSIDYSLTESRQSVVDQYLEDLTEAVIALEADETKAVATFEINASETEVHPGDIFDVDLDLTTNYGLVAASYCVIYDSTAFELYVDPDISYPTIDDYVDVSDGCLADYAFTGSTTATNTLFSRRNSNTSYWNSSSVKAQYKALYITFSYDSDKGYFVTPDGTVATVKFKAIADEVTPVEGNIFMSSDFNKTASFAGGVNYASRGVGVTLGVNDEAISCYSVGQTLDVDTEGAEITVRHIPGDAPTCTEPQICTVDGCGKVLAPATGHTPGEWVVAIPATAAADGREDHLCAVCGAVIESRIIPRLAVSQEASIAPGRQYNGVSGVNSVITINELSSYTAQFVTTYTPSQFITGTKSITPKLMILDTDGETASALPAGAKITLIDLTVVASPVFYSYTADGTESSIDLTSFVTAGASVNYAQKTVTSEIDERFVFVVDYLPTSSDHSLKLALGYNSYDSETSTNAIVFGGNNLVAANIGTTVVSLTATEGSASMTSTGSNSFPFDFTFSVSGALNTLYDVEGTYGLKLTLDESCGTLPGGSYIIVDGEKYTADNGAFYVPVEADEDYSFTVVTPGYIDDGDGTVTWNGVLMNSGSGKAFTNYSVEEFSLEYSNDNTVPSIKSTPVTPIVAKGATSTNVTLEYRNISSATVAVEVKDPTTGVYTPNSGLTQTISSLPSSGGNVTVNLSGLTASGTTYRLIFSGQDEGGNTVTSHTSYVVVSFMD